MAGDIENCNSIFLTDDGSFSVYNNIIKDSYHSKFGAISESLHIFINEGFKYQLSKGIILKILEVGFGTGLNAFLSFLEASKIFSTVHYTAVEAYPLPKEIYTKLDYHLLANVAEERFLKLHETTNKKKIHVSDNFEFIRIDEKIQNLTLPENYFNLVYFDAFNPTLQPELWSEDVFKKIYGSMTKDSVLLTYSSKGDVRRAMKSAGFIVKKIKGPLGKREITRALKL